MPGSWSLRMIARILPMPAIIVLPYFYLLLIVLKRGAHDGSCDPTIQARMHRMPRPKRAHSLLICARPLGILGDR